MAFKVLADNGISISAPQDGAMYNFFANNQNVILDGIGNEFAVSYTANSLVITVGTGEAIISGRSITATETNTLTLSANSTLYICLRIDLTQTAGNEGMIVALTSQDLIQSGNLNNGGNVCDILLGTAVTGTSGVTSFSDKRTIQPAVIPPTSTAGQVLASTATGYGWANAFKTSRKYCLVGSNGVDGVGWYKVASQTMYSNSNTSITFLVTSPYLQYYSGIFELQVRCGSTEVTCYTAKWLTRNGFPEDSIRVVCEGTTWTLYVYRKATQWAKIIFDVLGDYILDGEIPNYTLYNSTVPEESEPVATATSSDAVPVIKNTLYTANLNDLKGKNIGDYGMVAVSYSALNNPANANGVCRYSTFRDDITYQEFMTVNGATVTTYKRKSSGDTWTSWLLQPNPTNTQMIEEPIGVGNLDNEVAVAGQIRSLRYSAGTTGAPLSNSSGLCLVYGFNDQYTFQTAYSTTKVLTRLKSNDTWSDWQEQATTDYVDTQIDTRLDGLTLKVLTQSEYDALATKDANTLYLVKEDA